MQGQKVGVYIDSTNIAKNGGYKMRYNVLREFACRGGSEPVRLNAYVSYDSDRAQKDGVYRNGQQNFYAWLRDFGFKVIKKNVKWYTDETGNRYGKANADLDLAVDALTQSENIDRVLLATGDGDFVPVVRVLQNKGCRVEVVAFDNVSPDLKDEADMFISGYLIPELLPVNGNAGHHKSWGEVGSKVRGICYSHNSEKDYGFFRYMASISRELWKMDSRDDGSPYKSAFFHDSQLPDEMRSSELPSRHLIFEFELQNPLKEGAEVQATNIQLVSPRRKS
jgi:uncharacterized LabA/DUF88 family protein